MTTEDLLETLAGIARDMPDPSPEMRWCLFGSALRNPVGAADFDLAIVCRADRARAVREHLAPWCLVWPLHLTILTPEEDAALGFTEGQAARQFYPVG